MAAKGGKGGGEPISEEPQRRVVKRRPVEKVKLQPSGTIANPGSIEEVYRIRQWEVRQKASGRTKSFAEKMPTESELMAGLRPYAEAIGHANIEWNNLQEWFSLCFWKIFENSDPEAMAIWGVIKSDRTQREMVIEAAKVKFLARVYRDDIVSDTDAEKAYAIYDRLKFLYDKAQIFEDLRNDAIHSPIKMNISADHLVVYVDDQNYRGNEFKQKLKKRGVGILDELAYLRKSVRILNGFANQFWHAWVKDTELPPIPRLPSRAPRRTRKPKPKNGG